MQILVVEDEMRLARALKQILEEQGYRVDTVFDGLDGLSYAQSGIYDVLVLDVMLPRLNGCQIAAELRRSGLNTKILMLTAKETVADKVAGLDAGADDYMTKPFAPEELLARIRALLRRPGEVVSEEQRFEDLTFCASTATLSCAERSLRLNFKEAALMKLLLSHPGTIWSKEALIVKVWGYDSEATDSSVEAYMSFLRKKLHYLGSRVGITAVKKQGYRLEKKIC